MQHHQPLQQRLPPPLRLGQTRFYGRWRRCCEDYHLCNLLAGLRAGSCWELTGPVPNEVQARVEKILHQPFRN